MRLGVEAGAHTFDVAVEHGIRGVPISAQALAADGLEKTLAPLRERSLQVCQIGAFGFNPLHPDPARRAAERELVEQVIPLAAKTGCRYIVVCGGNYHPSGFAAGDARNFSQDALDEAARGLAP
ncbi:MAG: sugar phosphate isomerase/epimerase, partial [Anaerolineae bacterium]|nr:sugar phosphate isomerase/epimerase [Anaerolineae bacterium]